MKKLSLLFLLALAFLAGRAQTTQTIRGVVTDKTSEKPLPGVSIVITGTNLGAVSDSAGRYVITGVPLGRRLISYGSAGYHSASIPEVLVTAGKEVILDMALEQRLVTLKTFTITAAAAKKAQPPTSLPPAAPGPSTWKTSPAMPAAAMIPPSS